MCKQLYVCKQWLQDNNYGLVRNTVLQTAHHMQVLPAPLLPLSGEHNQAVLLSSLVRWNRLSSSHNSSTEDQLLSTQNKAAPQEMSDHPDSAYTRLQLHTHNSIQTTLTPQACISFCICIHKLYATHFNHSKLTQESLTYGLAQLLH